MNGVLKASHLRAVFSHPMRLIGPLVRRLIEIVDVVAEIVMQHPTIGSNTRLQGKSQIVEAIKPRGAKRIDMLMVVIDGGDEHAKKHKRKDTQRADQRSRQRPEHQTNDQNRHHIRNRTAIGFVSKYATATIRSSDDLNVTRSTIVRLTDFQAPPGTRRLPSPI